MKKIITLVLCGLVLALGLMGCSPTTGDKSLDKAIDDAVSQGLDEALNDALTGEGDAGEEGNEAEGEEEE